MALCDGLNESVARGAGESTPPPDDDDDDDEGVDPPNRDGKEARKGVRSVPKLEGPMLAQYQA